MHAETTGAAGPPIFLTHQPESHATLYPPLFQQTLRSPTYNSVLTPNQHPHPPLHTHLYGHRSVVFDTGQHDVGGRIATRSSLDSSLKRKAGSGSGAAAVAGQGQAPPAGARFDHAAQFFTATDPLFQAEVAGWMSQGLVKEWQGPVGSLNAKDGR